MVRPMQKPVVFPFLAGVALFSSIVLAACGDANSPAAPGTCGNGTVDTGEECDDGNTTSGDGCSSACAKEAVSALCGNGTIDPGEQCDDGNGKSGDGCSAACTNEGTDTNPSCGNGKLEAGEECDDGNKNSGDGCEASCKKSAKEVVCKTVPPIADGTCAVTAGSAAKLVTGNVLVPGTIYRGGSVLVDDKGLIACVGCDCEAKAQGATAITCPSGVISPALINTHDHITYAQNDPYKDTGERYEHRHDWRKGQNGHTKINTPGGASADQVHWAELRFLMGGAASTVGSGSASGLVRNLDKSADEMGINQTPVDFETFPLGDSGGTELTSGCSYGSIRTNASIAGDDAFLPHVAEGINAAATNEFVCLSSTANGGHDLVEAKTSLIHSIGLRPSDYAEIGKSGATVIWSPRSNITLYGDTALVTEAARLGVRIALGTDWVATGSMNLLRELQCADGVNKTYLGGFFSDEDLWRMVTVDAAKATATDDVLGTLAEGKVADIAIFDGKTHKDFRAIIDAAPQDVALVMRGGKLLYGDQKIVSTVPSTGACDAMDVCGTSKQVCLQDEIGKNLDGLTKSVGKIYAAYFCGTPENEPSCTPKRPKSVNGSTIYTGAVTELDADGDGIPNTQDNCPKVFNPVRPMDAKGKQADADADGTGDACDVCPLDANTTACTGFNSDDTDNDGVANATDNCPTTPNADQKDTDGDKKGDACDACAGTANPGNAACPASIYDIKKGVVAPSSAVSVVNALVTARNATGFYLQAKTGDPGYAGAEFSGVYVYDPSNTTKAGDRVTIVTSTVKSFNGQIQLNGPTTQTVTSANEAAPDPVVVTSAEVATNGAKAAAYESVIVQVKNTKVTDIAPAAGPGDAAPTNEFVLDGGVRVNDFLYLVTPFPKVGTAYDAVAGVLDYRNGNSKIEPRAASDYVLGPATLESFSTSNAFVRVGAAGAIPAALSVTFTRAVAADTFVTVTSSAPSELAVANGGVTIPSGQSSAVVTFDPPAAATTVTLTASADGKTATTSVRVLEAASPAALVSLTPATSSIVPGATATLTVTLDIPAPTDGAEVTLEVTPANAGTLPATVTVPANQTSTTFSYVDGSTVASATVKATLGTSTQSATVEAHAATGGLVINEVEYDNVGTDTAEYVEIYNASSAPIALTGYTLYLVNGSGGTVYKTIDLGPAGTLDGGQYLVIGSTSAVGTVPSSQKKIDLGAVSNLIENGAPDGMALVNTATNKLVDALAYEGAMTSVTLPGVGATSLVRGTALAATVADSNTALGSLCRLPNGADTNDSNADWKFSTHPTPGAANVP